MGTSLIDNFDYRGRRFLDGRQSVATLAALRAMPETEIPDGFRAYCAEDAQWYEYCSANSDDATTGRWRVVEKFVAKSVTKAKLAENAVTTDIIADESVTEDKLKEASVTEHKIAINAVTTDKIAERSITPALLSDSTINLINASGGGSISNMPDDEDFISETLGNGISVLKLKNRLPENGKGFVILRKEKDIAEQLNQENTIYEVRYAFNLNGREIVLPKKSTLRFNGGKFSNGTIVGSSTTLEALPFFIFENITIEGKWDIDRIFCEYFAEEGELASNATNAFQIACDVAGKIGAPLFLLQKRYFIKDSITLPAKLQISGANKHNSIIDFVVKDKTLFVGTTESSLHTYYLNNLTATGHLSAIMFDVANNGSELSNCTISEFGIVFNRHLNHVANIHDCSFQSINEAVFNDGVTDSVICNNYLNGYRPGSRAVLFNGLLTHSTVSGNYVDYFKTVVRAGCSESIITNNKFDLCYRVLDGNRPIKKTIFSDNEIYNIYECVKNTSVGFLNVDEEMEKIPPAAIFSCSIDADYNIKYTYNGITESVIANNSFDGDIVIESPMNGLIMRNNTYGNSTFRCTLGTVSNTAQELWKRCHIDYFDGTEIDSLYESDGVYIGCRRVYQGVDITCSEYNSGNYYWNNAMGQRIVSNCADPVSKAFLKGCLNLKYKGRCDIVAGQFKPSNHYECTDFNEIDGYLSLRIKAPQISSYYVIYFYDEEKQLLTTKSFNRDLQLDIPVGSRYMVIKAPDSINLGYIEVYSIPRNVTGESTNRPELAEGDAGFQYFDITLGRPIWWTGAKWIDSGGGDA